jgi:hypothetical protein
MNDVHEIRVSGDVFALLKDDAVQRGLTVQRFASLVLSAVALDRLFDAVIAATRAIANWRPRKNGRRSSTCGGRRARSRRERMSLSGVKRTCAFALHMSAFDPKRTCATVLGLM